MDVAALVTSIVGASIAAITAYFAKRSADAAQRSAKASESSANTSEQALRRDRHHLTVRLTIDREDFIHGAVLCVSNVGFRSTTLDLLRVHTKEGVEWKARVSPVEYGHPPPTVLGPGDMIRARVKWAFFADQNIDQIYLFDTGGNAWHVARQEVEEIRDHALTQPIPKPPGTTDEPT